MNQESHWAICRALLWNSYDPDKKKKPIPDHADDTLFSFHNLYVSTLPPKVLVSVQFLLWIYEKKVHFSEIEPLPPDTFNCCRSEKFRGDFPRQCLFV